MLNGLVPNNFVFVVVLGYNCTYQAPMSMSWGIASLSSGVEADTYILSSYLLVFSINLLLAGYRTGIW